MPTPEVTGQVKRVLVIGSSGAGKSTLAMKMGEILNLPVIHLDAHFWRAGWRDTPHDEWRRVQEELVKGDRWIIDGDYLRDLDLRLARADTVVLLEFGRLTCLAGVIKRWARHRGRSRPDMAAGCPEKLGLEFLLWVWRFPGRRHRTRELLAEYGSHCRLIVLRSRVETVQFIKGLS